MKRLMNEYAAVNDQLVAVDGADHPDPNGELYASLIAKEQRILNVIQRVDDTRRSEAMRKEDRVAPLLSAYIKGFASFVDGVIRYTSTGNYDNLLSLIASSDGMVYMGTLFIGIAIVLAMF